MLAELFYGSGVSYREPGHGNRRFELDYRPAPYIEMLNQALESVPSLYEYQRRTRLQEWSN